MAECSAVGERRDDPSGAVPRMDRKEDADGAAIPSPPACDTAAAAAAGVRGTVVVAVAALGLPGHVAGRSC